MREQVARGTGEQAGGNNQTITQQEVKEQTQRNRHDTRNELNTDDNKAIYTFQFARMPNF